VGNPTRARFLAAAWRRPVQTHVGDGCPRPSNAPPTATGDESRAPTASAPRPCAFSRPDVAGRFGAGRGDGSAEATTAYWIFELAPLASASMIVAHGDRTAERERRREQNADGGAAPARIVAAGQGLRRKRS
jgi:hypothetical protein